MTNVLEYLEETVKHFPHKQAFVDDETSLTFLDTYNQARSVGSFLYQHGYYNNPVVVFMKRSPKTIAAFWGVIYAGCYYIPLDEQMPRYRIELILGMLDNASIICDETTAPLAKGFSLNNPVFIYETIMSESVNSEALSHIREKQIDTDPIYVVFTSGSTGVPKGVMGCHRAVIDYVEHFCEVMKFSDKTIFGSQTPLYFDACLKEIFPTVKYGATDFLIPKQLFMFPVKLVEYLNQHRINTICWVVSALTIISSLHVFQKVKPQYLEIVAFASEVFPVKQFKIWKDALPHTRFINLYGPTEITGICCYYEVDREFKLDERIPIGRPFRNTDIILLDEHDRVPQQGQPGEICVRGTCLTLGYYRNPSKTAETFVQNPLNNLYPELVYRTGDIGAYNQLGELIFIARKDHQIKHMGHRIELGEIESAVSRQDGIVNCCCLYNSQKNKILLFYVGEVNTKSIMDHIRKILPRYMLPNSIYKLPMMPLTPNGKVDRTLLKNEYLKTEE